MQYRSFAGPTKHRYSDEQYIEVRLVSHPSSRSALGPDLSSVFCSLQMFDTDLINIPLNPPEWFADGERMWREEEDEQDGTC